MESDDDALLGYANGAWGGYGSSSSSGGCEDEESDEIDSDEEDSGGPSPPGESDRVGESSRVLPERRHTGEGTLDIRGGQGGRPPKRPRLHDEDGSRGTHDAGSGTGGPRRVRQVLQGPTSTPTDDPSAASRASTLRPVLGENRDGKDKDRLRQLE